MHPLYQQLHAGSHLDSCFVRYAQAYLLPAQHLPLAQAPVKPAPELPDGYQQRAVRILHSWAECCR